MTDRRFGVSLAHVVVASRRVFHRVVEMLIRGRVASVGGFRLPSLAAEDGAGLRRSYFDVGIVGDGAAGSNVCEQNIYKPQTHHRNDATRRTSPLSRQTSVKKAPTTAPQPPGLLFSVTSVAPLFRTTFRFACVLMPNQCRLDVLLSTSMALVWQLPLF